MVPVPSPKVRLEQRSRRPIHPLTATASQPPAPARHPGASSRPFAAFSYVLLPCGQVGGLLTQIIAHF